MSGSTTERDMDIKAFGPLDIKDADKGEVEAIVATLNVVDGDGDVILPGAFALGRTVKISSYAHDVVLDGAPPVGKGVIHEEGGKAVFRGRFFMSTIAGKEAFQTVKELGPDSEWSFGFRRQVRQGEMTKDWKEKGASRVIAGLEQFEVSPVLVGAGIGTQTVGVKSEGGAALPEVAEPAEPPADPAEVEAKAVADLEAERQAQDLLRAEDDRVAQRMALKQAATDEFERLQRNLRRFGVR